MGRGADGRALLNQVLESIGEADRKWCALLSPPPTPHPRTWCVTRCWLQRSITVAGRLEREELASEPLDYEIRYQPIVRLTNRSIVGFEAKLRARLG